MKALRYINMKKEELRFLSISHRGEMEAFY